jgi:RHS repeat-associated protein
MATADASGTLTATFAYDPFGNVLGSSTPNNAPTGTTYGWAGQHQKLQETTIDLKPIQMGARVYLSTLGRFTSPDPIEGGTQNNYVYVVDPVNGNDYSGLFCLQSCSNIASFLQPAAPAAKFQPAAKASTFQPANANIQASPSRTPQLSTPRTNSFAKLPVAKLKGVDVSKIPNTTSRGGPRSVVQRHDVTLGGAIKAAAMGLCRFYRRVRRRRNHNQRRLVG